LLTLRQRLANATPVSAAAENGSVVQRIRRAFRELCYKISNFYNLLHFYRVLSVLIYRTVCFFHFSQHCSFNVLAAVDSPSSIRQWLLLHLQIEQRNPGRHFSIHSIT